MSNTTDEYLTDEVIEHILPLGKEGCEECKDLPCYCDDCTQKMLDYLSRLSIEA